MEEKEQRRTERGGQRLWVGAEGCNLCVTTITMAQYSSCICQQPSSQYMNVICVNDFCSLSILFIRPFCPPVLSICSSVHQSVRLSIHLFAHLYIHPSFLLSIHPSTSASHHIHPIRCASVHLIHPFTRLSINPSNISICSSILSIYPSIPSVH